MANVAKVAMRFEVNAFYAGGDDHEDIIDDVVVTFHVHQADVLGPIDDAELLLLGQTVEAWWRHPYEDMPAPRDEYSGATALAGVEAHNIAPAEGLENIWPLDDDNRGGSTSPAAPPQTCVLLSWLTELDSRRGRGRMYMPAPHAQFVDSEGLLWGDNLGVAASWGRKLYRQIADSLGNTPNLRVCVWSELDGDARTVTAVRAASHLRTQRRRAKRPVFYEQVGFEA